MNNLNSSRKLAARSRAGLCSTLFLLAGLLALVTPLRAVNPPTYLFQIDNPTGDPFYPESVALDASNNLYTSVNGSVMKFSSGGTYLTQWAADAAGIAVDISNNVYVTDAVNDRIEKFDSNGNYLTQWGSYGTGNGQFDQPCGIAVDSSNNVYVVDLNNYRVEKFTSNGGYLTQWGSYGYDDGQFTIPAYIAADRGNNVYVTDVESGLVQKFTSNGTFLTQWANMGGTDNPAPIAVDNASNVYVIDYHDDLVERFTSNGTYLTQWGGWSEYGEGDGLFDEPGGIAVDGTGNFIYVADTDNSRIQVFVNNTNIVPPIITQQPVNQTVGVGMNVMFGVGVIGTAPFTYQWSSNNVAVPGATSATLTLTNISLSAYGSQIGCLVSNAYGTAVSSSAVLIVSPPSLVQNGGFELGTFADWTTSGGFLGEISSFIPYVHSGFYGAELAAIRTLGYISQTTATTVGQKYLISCWFYCDGVITNEFSVSWGGATLFDQQNISATPWTNLQFQASATTTKTVLTFGFRDDYSFLGLDDIVVYPILPPQFQTVTPTNGRINLSWNAVPGQSYQVQYTTNLAQNQWANLGGVLSTNTASLTATDTTTVSSKRFYRIVLLP